ncbi:hypothetical protein PG988_011306 [Apiospora saccharicola]
MLPKQVFVTSRCPVGRIGRAASLAILARSRASVSPGQLTVRWKTTTKEKGEQKEQSTVEDGRFFRKLPHPERLWGWNLSAADLPKFRETKDDDKLTTTERGIKSWALKNLEESLEISDKCSALGDDRSSQYSRRAAVESLRSTWFFSNVYIITEKRLEPLNKSNITAPDVEAAIAVVEDENLKLLKLNLALVQSLAFGEAFKVFLREIQEARRRPDLMDKVVVPFVAPRIILPGHSSQAVRYPKVVQMIGGAAAASTPPRLDNGALWLARLSKRHALTRSFPEDFFRASNARDKNWPAMFEIASRSVLEHRPDLARVVGWALAAERIKCEIHLAGVQQLITKWRMQCAYLLRHRRNRKAEWPEFLPQLTNKQRCNIGAMLYHKENTKKQMLENMKKQRLEAKRAKHL